MSGAEEAGDYRPVPLAASDVVLDDDLKALTEILAEDAHDAWAAVRFEEGWEYGPHHDADARLHPNLVPYGALTEVEKDIDRGVVVAIVRGILAHGYELRRSASH